MEGILSGRGHLRPSGRNPFPLLLRLWQHEIPFPEAFMPLRSPVLPLLLLAFLAPGAAGRQGAEFRWPDTPAAKQMERLVEALNSGEVAKLRQFVEGAYARQALAERPAAERAARFLEVYGDTRG